MTHESAPTGNGWRDEIESTIIWPLAYRLQTVQQPTFAQGWSHRLYQSPEGKKVQVLYSADKAKSEELAQRFLNEPVVGFDMEWPMYIRDSDNPPLQKRIGLIQVASETTVALFHIGLHGGKTTAEIIAPSLRKLIESPTIAKTGVAIFNADFARLRKYFGLKPQGAFELSHLDHLVKFAHDPYYLLNTKTVALAHLVETHLGLPLGKGPVRTSNWSKALSQKQKDYAASDAYAGFMLFHCMNAKRAALRPTPGLPIFADQYPRKPKREEGEKGFAPIRTLMLHSVEKEGAMIAAIDFFDAKRNQNESESEADAQADATVTKGKKEVTKAKPSVAREQMSPATLNLYDKLSERRKSLAEASDVPVYLIASNAVLRGIAESSPQNNQELLKVRGIGKVSIDKYGADWLKVIAQHVAVDGAQRTGEPSNIPVDTQQVQPIIPTRRTRRERVGEQESPDSLPAFGSPLQRTPTLHTELSFTFAETKLDADTGLASSLSMPYKLKTPSNYSDVEFLDLTKDAPHGHVMSGAAAPARTESPPALLGETSANGSSQWGASRWSLNSTSTSEDSLASQSFYTPPSSLKRKRAETRPNTVTPNPAQAQPFPFSQASQTGPAVAQIPPAPLSPQSKIFRNKLLAFSKLITRKLGPRTLSTPIVSDSTLDLIVTVSPRTAEELNRITGIEEFTRACQMAQMDLL
ncbi:hypothetical protein BU23DRAFT_557380 [Bimuria novae-zelandiae CBS 107.79]|uniref:HRDC domain-containing protein n=1 Tax=Bimuria novae-zelandiae CBS 107.79 TaxID=1447943 RepID=A0A6A5V400_9PLEO|nr:hypothetical protein BU23DRAFT_557380 [Bimuria novae-zelandiae CBS 107.79]